MSFDHNRSVVLSADERRIQSKRGFTLIELLVTMALLAVMLALAAPSFVTFQRNSELTSSANAFVASLSAARAEAMKRQRRVFVVPADAARTDWSAGWIVFVDVDNTVTTGSAAQLVVSGTDILVSTQVALPSTVTVTTTTVDGFANGSQKFAMFNGSGFMTNLAGRFVTQGLELTSVTGESRRIIANTTGRLRVCKPAEAGCDATETL